MPNSPGPRLEGAWCQASGWSFGQAAAPTQVPSEVCGPPRCRAAGLAVLQGDQSLPDNSARSPSSLRFAPQKCFPMPTFLTAWLTSGDVSSVLLPSLHNHSISSGPHSTTGCLGPTLSLLPHFMGVFQLPTEAVHS